MSQKKISQTVPGEADDEANPLDTGAADTSSFQAQLNTMNENGVSADSVAPFDKVEVTGVMQNSYQQSLTHAVMAACPGFDAVHPKGSFGAIIQWCAAQVDNGVSLRNIHTHFGDQLSPGGLSQPEINGNGLLGLQQHMCAFDDGLQSPRRLP